MAATAAAAAEFFGTAAATEVAGSSALAIGAGTAETAGVAATSLGSAAAFDGAAVAGAAGVGTAATKLLSSPVGGAVALSQLMPKPQTPGVRPVTAMPDPLEQAKARERSIIEQLARRGRSASILTAEAPSNTLGGG